MFDRFARKRVLRDLNMIMINEAYFDRMYQIDLFIQKTKQSFD